MRQIFLLLYRGTALASYLQSPFLLLIRLYFGIGFFLSGSGKLQNIEQVAQYFETLHIPLPLVNAYFVGWVETICGLLLALGFLSRLISIPLIINMSVAYATAHVDALRGLFTDPAEFLKASPFLFLFAALIVFIFGPGKFSIDYGIAKDEAEV